MVTFNSLMPIITGCWLVSIAFLSQAKGTFGCFVFKIIPFFLGLLSIIAGLRLLGII